MYPFAETQFKNASGEVATFELRMRILAGNISPTRDYKIRTDLSKLIEPISLYFQSTLMAKEKEFLEKVCKLRNKLLHCEFSTARECLNDIEPKIRNGEVKAINIEGLNDAEARAKIIQVIAGTEVGQTKGADTETSTHKDIYGWLLDYQQANGFEETAKIFQQANSILERLVLKLANESAARRSAV